MNRHHPPGAEIGEGRERLSRIHVVPAHDLAGMDGPDGQEREIDPREAPRRLGEQPLRIGRVAGEIHGHAAVLDDVPRERPGHPRAVDPVAKAGVDHRHRRDAESVRLPRLPPPQLERGEVQVGDVDEPARGHEERPCLVLDRLEGPERQMIHVHVRHEDRVERRQALCLDARRDEPRAQHADRAGEHRIGEDDLVLDLDERRRMADPHDGEAGAGVDGLFGVAGRGPRPSHERRRVADEEGLGGRARRTRQEERCEDRQLTECHAPGDRHGGPQKYRRLIVSVVEREDGSGACVTCSPSPPKRV